MEIITAIPPRVKLDWQILIKIAYSMVDIRQNVQQGIPEVQALDYALGYAVAGWEWCFASGMAVAARWWTVGVADNSEHRRTLFHLIVVRQTVNLRDNRSFRLDKGWSKPPSLHPPDPVITTTTNARGTQRSVWVLYPPQTTFVSVRPSAVSVFHDLVCCLS